MRTPFDSGLLEVVDRADRRVSYIVVYDEESETLGLIAWLDRRMVCLCSIGRAAYEDRLDGSLTWGDEGCAHESIFLGVKKQRETPALGISGERTYAVSPGLYE